MDECETEVCPGENEQCKNTEGSYRCVCAEGYKQIEGICVKEQIPGEQTWGGEVLQGEGQQILSLGNYRSCPTHPLDASPHEAALRSEAYI